MPPTSYSELVLLILGFINVLIPGIFALMFAFFVWKMIDAWVINAADEAKRNQGKNYAVAAIVAFVLMVTVLGIVTMVKNTFFPTVVATEEEAEV